MVDTGDAMPAGTNAVIMIEDVHIDGPAAKLRIQRLPWPGLGKVRRLLDLAHRRGPRPARLTPPPEDRA